MNQVAARLDEHLQLFQLQPATGVPERHHNLHAALEWSHRRLTVPEQAALRRLAVFRADFDLAGVALIESSSEAPVAAAAVDGCALVSRLVDKSFVTPVAGPADELRYRLLAPVRQYAAAKLCAAGEVDLTRIRHRDIFLARCHDLYPLMSGRVRRQHHADMDNLRAALEWSWAHDDHCAAIRLVAAQVVSWVCVTDYGESRARWNGSSPHPNSPNTQCEAGCSSPSPWPCARPASGSRHGRDDARRGHRPRRTRRRSHRARGVRTDRRGGRTELGER